MIYKVNSPYQTGNKSLTSACGKLKGRSRNAVGGVQPAFSGFNLPKALKFLYVIHDPS